MSQPVSVVLSWGASATATSYMYCIRAVSDTTCLGGKWITTGLARSADLSSLGLAPGTVYYWQVRALNNFGYRGADNGSWWSFTTSP